MGVSTNPGGRGKMASSPMDVVLLSFDTGSV